MKKLSLVLALASATCTFAFAGNEGMNASKHENTTTEESAPPPTLITVYKATRNNVTATPAEAAALPTQFTIYFTTLECRNWWLSQYTLGIACGTCKQNSYFYSASGTAQVDPTTTFLISCPF